MAFVRASEDELAARSELASLVAEDLRAAGLATETGPLHRGSGGCGGRVCWDTAEGPTVVYVQWYVHPDLRALHDADWVTLVRQDIAPSFDTAPAAMRLAGVATMALREALGRRLREAGYGVADPAELLKRVQLEVTGAPAPDGWRLARGVVAD